MENNFITSVQDKELPNFVFSKDFERYYFFEMPIGQALLLQLVNILHVQTNSQKLKGIFINLNYGDNPPYILFDYETFNKMDLKKDTFSAYQKCYIQSEKWELFSLFDNETLIVAIEHNFIEVFEQELKRSRNLYKMYMPFTGLISYFKSLMTITIGKRRSLSKKKIRLFGSTEKELWK